MKIDGKEVLELKYPDKYDKFKKLVKSKTVRFFSSNDGIRAAVIQALFDIQNRFNLKGWVRGDEVIDVKPLIKQIDTLSQENAALKLQLKNSDKRKLTVSESKRSLKQFEFENTVYTVEHWRDMLTKILDILAESRRLKDPDTLLALNNNRAVFFTFDEKKVSRPYKIPLTKMYLGTHQSPDSFQRLAKAVVKAVGLPDNAFKIIGELPRS